MNFLTASSLAVATFLPALGSSAATPAEYKVLMKHCEGISSTRQCYEAIEAAQAKSMNRTKFSRQGELLVVKTQKANARFRNVDAEGPKAASYTYLTFLPEPRLHVVFALYWEGSEYAVVSDASGRLTKLQGFPVTSPDSTRVVATSASGESGYYANLVEVWSLGSSPRIEFKYAPKAEEWEPGEAEWTGPSTIRVPGTCKPRTESPKRCNKVIRETQGLWRITDDA